MINTEMKDTIEYDIRKAVSEYMTANAVSKREAIYKVQEIIKKLAEECKQGEELLDLIETISNLIDGKEV